MGGRGERGSQVDFCVIFHISYIFLTFCSISRMESIRQGAIQGLGDIRWLSCYLYFSGSGLSSFILQCEHLKAL